VRPTAHEVRIHRPFEKLDMGAYRTEAIDGRPASDQHGCPSRRSQGSTEEAYGEGDR